jgi:hypothetical protein
MILPERLFIESFVERGEQTGARHRSRTNQARPLTPDTFEENVLGEEVEGIGHFFGKRQIIFFIELIILLDLLARRNTHVCSNKVYDCYLEKSMRSIISLKC